MAPRKTSAAPPSPVRPTEELLLYSYEHCPYCALAEAALHILGCSFDRCILPYDDEATPTRLTGAKMLPILAGKNPVHTNDVVAMSESMVICRYAEELSGKQLLGHPPNIDSVDWFDGWMQRLTTVSAALCLPRWVEQGAFGEFASAEAQDYYRRKKDQSWAGWTPEGVITPESADSILSTMHSQSSTLLAQLVPILAELEARLPDIHTDTPLRNAGIWGSAPSFHDLILLSELRCLTIVKNLQMPFKITKWLDRWAKECNIQLHYDLAVS